MDERTKARVRERAGNRCEYCKLHQEDSPLAALHVEHIIPRVHGGTDRLENLALACIDCNLHKGTNLTEMDPDSDQESERSSRFSLRPDTLERIAKLGATLTVTYYRRETNDF